MVGVQYCRGRPDNRTQIGTAPNCSLSGSNKGSHRFSNTGAISMFQNLERIQSVYSSWWNRRANHPLARTWIMGKSLRREPHISSVQSRSRSTVYFLPRMRPTRTFLAVFSTYPIIRSSPRVSFMSLSPALRHLPFFCLFERLVIC